MKEKLKHVYYCDHCGKHGLRKDMMEYHEKICLKNPYNYRPCFGCVHLVKRETTTMVQYYHSEEFEKRVSLLYCEKKKLYLYTPKNEVKENFYDLGDDLNEPMPRVCQGREEWMRI